MQATSRLFEVEVFVAVVDAGSFTDAGGRLGITSSYASKLVSRLEQRLGVRLLQRTTRRLTLTEAGAAFFESSAEALAVVAAAEDAASEQQAALRGRLRVSLPTVLGQPWLSRHITGFVCGHPGLVLDLVYLDRVVDLVGEGFDVAVRVGELPDSGLALRRLASTERVLVASPAYIERNGAPETIDALQERSCLRDTSADAPQRWTLTRGDETRRITVHGSVLINRGDALVMAAEMGIGVAYVPAFDCAAQLQAGSLQRILPDWGQALPIVALYPSRRHLPRRVRVFSDALARCLASPPWAAQT